jgi:hypothetical protein
MLQNLIFERAIIFHHKERLYRMLVAGAIVADKLFPSVDLIILILPAIFYGLFILNQ